MPRTAREIGDSGICHVMLRGIDRQRIFEDDEDRERFLDILKKTREKDGFDLIAWCLMPNHVHLPVHENAVKFQGLAREKRDAALHKALKGGVSIRQASRLTGISIGVIRRIGDR